MVRVGPGPARYLLPNTLGCKDHDPRKEKLPCYSIGIRFQTKKYTTGPGPANYTIEKCTRFGRDHERGYIGERIYLNYESQTPGPNMYSLPTTNVYQKKLPSYVIGKRLKGFSGQTIPAPNAYDIPGEIGSKCNVLSVQKSPAFSIRRRIENTVKSDIPGPKYYPQDCSKCRLLPTFKSRQNIPVKSITPGPNQYNLQSHRPGKRSPAYTMRGKFIDLTES